MKLPGTETAVRWNVIALAFAGPALLGTILYILWQLTPAKWCSVLIAGAKEAQVPAPECTSVLLKLLDLHKDAIWILGGTLGLVIVAIGLAATGMSFSGRFGKAEAKMGRGAIEGAEHVAEAAQDAADEVKG